MYIGEENTDIALEKNRSIPYSKSSLLEICKNYLPKDGSLKFIEIGCSPGYNVIDFHNLFGYQCFGVDYSVPGCDLTKKVFSINGLDPDNVVLSDFLSDEFQEKYKGYFDIVSSFGVIEHFDDSKEAIEKHINLLKDGAFLVITIPNIRGFFNRVLSSFFNNRVIPYHNLDIMDKPTFVKLFDTKKLMTMHCGYYGLFNLGLLNVSRNSNKRRLLRICYIIQFGIDMLFNRFFLKKNLECSLFSPYLIYIGQKNTK
jgi:SAM-dependent methyltransferase